MIEPCELVPGIGRDPPGKYEFVIVPVTSAVARNEAAGKIGLCGSICDRRGA
jgi:hypothetical protein